MRFLDRFLHPSLPELPPDMPLPPIPDHEPDYHEAASRSANYSARVALAERKMLAAETESYERYEDDA
jgi:hypothetical protein